MSTPDITQQWTDWLATLTDRVLELDERLNSSVDEGQAELVATTATAFVWRKAIADVLARIESAGNAAERDATSQLPVLDSAGAVVGDTLAAAAAALEQLVAGASAALDRRDRVRGQRNALIAGIDRDLAVATSLAVETGMFAAAVADATTDFGQITAALAGDTGSNQSPTTTEKGESAASQAADEGLAELAQRVGELRTELAGAADQQQRLLAQIDDLPKRLDALTSVEARVRSLATRCRAKILQCPPIAVPSVLAVSTEASGLLGQVAQGPSTVRQPWPALRAKAVPVLAKIDRLEAALAEAERRFAAPLDERDRLRGLLQGFRAKAASQGRGEHPELEPLYRAAEAHLWSEPCDLTTAARDVAAFIEAVNASSDADGAGAADGEPVVRESADRARS